MRLQRDAGNAAITGLLVRQPLPMLVPPVMPFYDPVGEAIRATARADLISVNERPDFVTADPVPQMPPAVASTVLAARATLSQIPKLGKPDLETMKYAAPGAPVLELIEKRERHRADIEANQSQISMRAPAARLPDDQQAAWEAEAAPFTQQIQYDEAEIQKTQTMIEAVVQGLGVADEAALVKLLTVDFPELFVRRGKLIAYRQLDDNARVAEDEARRYGLGIPGQGAGSYASPASFGNPEDIAGLRKGAARVRAIEKQIADIQETERRRTQEAEEAARDKYLQSEGEPGAGAGSYATAPVEAPDFTKEEAQLAQLNTERDAIRSQFPILYRPGIDLEGLTAASDDDLSRATGAEVGTILSNIADTKKAIENEDLKVWSLRGIVELTMIDLGVTAESPLVHVVERYAAETADEGLLHKALSALALVAGIVATVATGGVALFAGAVAFGIGGYELARSVKAYGIESAANEVALDPELADISVNDPEIMPIVMNVLSMGLAAGDLIRVVKAIRLPAKALAAGGDIGTFATAAKAVIPAEEAERFIAAAGRAVGGDEVTLNAIRAVGDTYRHADLAEVTRLLEQHAEVGYAKAFDRLAGTGRVHPLNLETVRFHLGEELANQLANDPLVRAWYHPANGGRLFVREGMTREGFAGWAVHETTHHLQEIEAVGSSLSFQGEFQAFRAQQDYVLSLERAAGEAAVPASMRWLRNATAERIAADITEMYGYQAPAVLESEALMQPLLDLLSRLEG
jgi:hypothetical protein